MKKLILIFVVAIFSLVASPIHARIGDTETEVKVNHAGYQIAEDCIDDRSKVVVFTDDKSQYAVAILDGKVECETFTNADDSKLSEDFILSILHSYAEVWFPARCSGDGCLAAISADGKYVSKYAPSKVLGKQNVFTVFTETWWEFSKTKQANKI